MNPKRDNASAHSEKPRTRKPPAYQEYASDVIADLHWRMMSLAERGLWDTLRKECWVNGGVPCEPEQLAKFLNIPAKAIAAALTSRVLNSFEIQDGWMVCPELEAYRHKLTVQHERMSEGGRRGGEKTQKLVKASGRMAKVSSPKSSVDEARQSTYEATLEAISKPLRREEPTRGEGDRLERNYLSPENAQWVGEYEEGFDATGMQYGQHRQ